VPRCAFNDKRIVVRVNLAVFRLENKRASKMSKPHRRRNKNKRKRADVGSLVHIAKQKNPPHFAVIQSSTQRGMSMDVPATQRTLPKTLAGFENRLMRT